MSSQVQLDPYIAQAQNDNVTPAQKLEGMHAPPLGCLASVSLLSRSAQARPGSADGYAHDARVRWSSPRESHDTGWP
jgi:hypothetical protein